MATPASFSAASPAGQLAQGLDALGLTLSPSQQAQLLAYLALLQKWNKVYNLTALRDANDQLLLHLLDSLSAIIPFRRILAQHAWAHPPRVLDVGSGGGLPGAVMAIACPEVHVTCVDAVAKKAAFVQQVAVQLALPNLQGRHARVETLTGPYDVICARAFASLPDFVAWTQQALSPSGCWMAMKGKHPQAELDALPPAITVFHVERLSVPGLAAQRCLVWMRG